MLMSGKNSHKRFQPKTREIKLRGQAAAQGSCRGMSGLCCYDSTRGTPSRRRPSYRHATRGSTQIAKGRFFCNQIRHNQFITNILTRFFRIQKFQWKITLKSPFNTLINSWLQHFWLQKNRPFAINFFSLIERGVATVCLPHAIKGLSFQHIWLTHKTLSFFIPMMGEFLNMNPHSRCTPGKKNSLLKMPMSGKNSHKRFQPKTREI